MSRVTRAEWYRRVNAAWPEHVPGLSDDEAIRAAKRLYRFAMKRTWRGPVRITSGNRYTWIRRGEMVINPRGGWQSGWKGMVHMLSHYAHSRLHPNERPHGGTHARLEMRMIKEVIRRGWLDGKLARAAQDRARIASEKQAGRQSPEFKLTRLRAREKRWITRTKRAVTALKKIRRQITRLERVTLRDGLTSL